MCSEFWVHIKHSNLPFYSLESYKVIFLLWDKRDNEKGKHSHE